uniref:Uncharacterized protein n=1 Tax=Fibrocapsa japonica TaxID=94617 RepID=A0A7S2UZJ9_9STRA|mmetsp:Transcript_19069/g.27522  ORF Transcript_19069/g.27522 Transcript_19069/m.27522 type:complete len:977 (+) Transcript_19069:86-3016(+)
MIPSKLLALAAFLLQGICAGGNVIGIDMGSEFMKVALVQPGSPLEIVINFHSKRKTPTYITFYKGERYYGSDAFGMTSKSPQSTYFHVGSLLGRDEDHPLSAQRLEGFRAGVSPRFNETRGGLVFDAPAAAAAVGEGGVFTPEELVGMLLSYARAMTKNFGGSTVQDCVLTVPSFATHLERRALLDAANIAGLKVLSLVEENTAAALQFGIDRIYENETNVLFYNMGSTSTQVSIVTYSSYGGSGGGDNKDSKKKDKKGSGGTGQFVVRGKGWDWDLGGSQMDGVMLDFLADEFNKKWASDGRDIRDVARPIAKLRAEAKKVKEVLSANSEIPVWMNSVYEDTDFNTMVKRELLEEMSAPLLARVTSPIDDALAAAGLTLSDIDIVELIGGSVRVPKVKQILKDYFGELELGIHLNQDESMALGAAFHAANLSTAFRVRKVGMQDINPFAIDLHLSDLPEEGSPSAFGGLLNRLWSSSGDKEEEAKDAGDEEAWTKKSNLYEVGALLDTKKKISFTHAQDVEVQLAYPDPVAAEGSESKNPQLPLGTRPLLAVYNVTGVGPFAKDLADKGLGSPKVVLHFHLQSSGLTVLSKAEAVLEEEIEYEAEEEVPLTDEELKEAEEAAKAEESAESEEEEESAEEASAEEASAESEEEEESAEEASAEEEEKTEKKKSRKKVKKTKTVTVTKTKKKVHKKPLKVVLSNTYMELRPYSAEMFKESTAKLDELQRLDEERMAKEEAKNSLESFIFQTRNRVYDEEETINQVSTEEQREEVLSECMSLEDWLYEDGFDASVEEYGKKKGALRKLGQAIFKRAEELTARPAAVEEARGILTKFRGLVTTWEEEKPWITEEERTDVLERIQKAEDWLAEQEEKQADQPSHEDPVFLSTDVDPKMKPVKSLMAKLNKKPKPAPPKPAENESETVEASSEEDLDKKSEEAEGETSGDSESQNADADEQTETAEEDGSTEPNDASNDEL